MAVPRRTTAAVALAAAALAAAPHAVAHAAPPAERVEQVAAAAPAASRCGPMDVVFALDDTGSMGGALNNIKTSINAVVGDVVSASGGDYRLGLVTFKDSINVVTGLAAGNAGTVTGYVTNVLAASGGGGEPEASDEALRTAVSLRPAAGIPQNADFTGPWRSNARKFVVLVTDARPGGFDDAFTAADQASATAVANSALAAGVKLSAVYVPTSPSMTPTIAPIMQNYATTTSGVYVQAQADGSGTADAIRKALSDCRRTDVFMRDQTTDNGVEVNPNGSVWASPDIKVCPTTADCATTYQPPVGSTSWIHVRLNNPGPYGSGTGAGTLKLYWVNPSGSTVWNEATGGDWTFIGQQAATVPAGTTVVKVPWTNVPGPGHFCLLARWVSANDPMTHVEGANTAQNAKNNNNIAWRNVDTVRVRPTVPGRTSFTLGNAVEKEIRTDLLFTSPGKPFVGAGKVVVDLGRELFERWQASGGQARGIERVGESAVQVLDPKQAALIGIAVRPGERFTAGLEFHGGEPGGEYLLHVVQRLGDEELGGVAYQVLVEKE
ncbi:vWA domain-containing protein [Actinosynnema mirum]|uniref:von Willebrand factor type A n=1 Tax=Actinosynnema mirum (strain ATCC 29888 / DSM 43827 / JCM 3225 / NBRC 14064 / NCIMB 13271 / NRRL B-12336 / IMRU 3971 / 101) TaxID=446462 RepID=C6WGM8_ACTMD|nr:vWA domain-containing protein [Actinosynnema mirum]ACU34344.1 von Willebrand factor type A [Actinosynnema mirum DSM 43827]